VRTSVLHVPARRYLLRVVQHVVTIKKLLADSCATIWWCDYLTLVNRHLIELDAVKQRVSSKYSFADTYRISEDPELLATLERQRSAMQELDSHRPVDEVKMQALRDTVPGVATHEFQGDKVVYAPGHDEIALAVARNKYGGKFVDWVVSREKMIARAPAE
jgi:hypothetical protein